MVGRLYSIQIYVYITKYTFPNPTPAEHTETPKLTYIPHLLAKYIQYQYIYSTYKCSQIVASIYPIPKYIFNLQIFPNFWQYISNTNIYIQLTNIPKLLAVVRSNTNIYITKYTFPNPNPP